jgi:cyclopropane fatty-acyl-phospholipid synthase-like methyltransferase
MINKPYAESCDQNRDPILGVIRPLLADASRVLEIGSGTGQHAVYFAARLPHLVWQCSDCAECLPGIGRWLAEAGLSNTPAPLALDVTSTWPALSMDAVFSANTTHIMHWPAVEAMFAGIGHQLVSHGRFFLYGPFSFNGAYSSESNARFDGWLQARDPHSGIRDFEALDTLARAAGLIFMENFAMPANNQILFWEKR